MVWQIRFWDFLKIGKVELPVLEKGGKPPRKHSFVVGLLPETPLFLPSSACGAGQGWVIRMTYAYTPYIRAYKEVSELIFSAYRLPEFLSRFKSDSSRAVIVLVSKSLTFVSN